MSHLIVNTNLNSVRAHNALKGVNTDNALSAQRLSSGLRINSAADDSSGMAISEKMRAQIRGLDQAQRNIQDASSLFMTGDGALAEINNMLIRIRELAIQSANDTNTDEDREKLDEECQQLLEEVDSMADSTEFNNIKILKSGVKTTKTIEYKETFTLKNLFMSRADYPVDVLGTKALPLGRMVKDLTTAVNDVSIFYINDAVTNATINTANYDFGKALAAAYNGSGTFDSFITNMYSVNPPSDNDKQTFLKTIEGAFNVVYAGMGVQAVAAYDSTGRLGIGFLGREDLKITFGGCYSALSNSWGHGFLHSVFSSTSEMANIDITTTTTEVIEYWPTKEIWVQSGANSEQGDFFEWNTVSVEELSLENTKLTPWEEAIKALDQVDSASLYVNEIRSTFGSYMNRLEYASKAVAQSSENLSSSESRIRDTDMAKEMMNYTKTNILASAATSMLAQANQAPQSILSLLRQ